MPQQTQGRKKRTIKDARAQWAAAQRRFKEENPTEYLKQQCRNAKRLLERNGFTVTGGNMDITPKRERYRQTETQPQTGAQADAQREGAGARGDE